MIRTWFKPLLFLVFLIPGPRVYVVVQGPGLVDQHDRNAVADGKGESGLFRDQLFRFLVVAERSLGQGADQDFQKLRIDGTFTDDEFPGFL